MRINGDLRALLSFILIVFLFIGCKSNLHQSDLSSTSTQIILLRHAEKVEGEGDVALTERGEKRSNLLADMLTDIKIDAVITTEWLRNQSTAKPISEKKGIGITTIPVGEDAAAHARLIVKKLKGDSLSGKKVVCIEHSNTIPLILQELGVEQKIENVLYSQLFIITLINGKKPTLLLLNYFV
jgi:phosphohistidine phosphatase SixA